MVGETFIFLFFEIRVYIVLVNVRYEVILVTKNKKNVNKQMKNNNNKQINETEKNSKHPIKPK